MGGGDDPHLPEGILLLHLLHRLLLLLLPLLLLLFPQAGGGGKLGWPLAHTAGRVGE